MEEWNCVELNIDGVRENLIEHNKIENSCEEHIKFGLSWLDNCRSEQAIEEQGKNTIESVTSVE